MFRKSVLFAVLLSLAVFCAAEDTLKTYTGKPVEVVGSKPAFAEADTVKTDNPSNSVLDEALRLSPNIYFTRHALIGYGVAVGAAGQVSLLGLGGSPTTQVLFTYDGDPLFMGLMGHPVYDAFSALGMGRIELVEGASPVDFGAGAMGGVINMTTKRLREKGIVPSVMGQFGSFGLLNSGAEIQGKTGKFDWGADYFSQHTDGYRDDANDAFWSQRFGGHLGFSTDKDDILLSGHYDWFCVYNPGPETAPADSNWYRIRRAHIHFHWRHSFGNFATEIGGFRHTGRHTIYDGYRGDDLSWGTRAELKYSGAVSHWGVKFSAVQMGGSAVNVVRGMDLGSHWATDYSTAAWYKRDFGKLTGKIGAALFAREGFKSHIAPEISLEYSLTPHEGIFTRVSNGFRFPSLRELEVFPWSNPNLEPENSWTAILGVRGSRTKFSWKLEFWHTYAENLIIYGWPGEPFENSGAFNRNGVSVQVDFAPVKGFEINTGLAYQDLNERKDISPGIHWTGEVKYSVKKLVPMWLSLSWEGARDIYASDDESDKLPDFLVGDIHLGIAPIPGAEFLRVKVAVDNFTDAKYYTQKGYPMPPRTIWAGVEIKPHLAGK